MNMSERASWMLSMSSVEKTSGMQGVLKRTLFKRLGRTKNFLSTKAKKSYYEILELTPKATQAQIKEAYYKLSLKYHPDQHQEKEIASESFRAITEAYEILINLQKKKLYDKGLYQQRTGPVTSADGSTAPRASSQQQPSLLRTSTFAVDQWHQDRYKDLINVKLKQNARAQTFKIKHNIKEVNRSSYAVLYLLFVAMFVYFKGMPYISQKLKNDDGKTQ
ncbi:DnaJ domain [Trinorchestia longiramus]|nr:DnaJ domain [Trinorchestia longiramus]